MVGKYSRQPERHQIHQNSPRSLSLGSPHCADVEKIV
jgi:hypothetical protein